MFLKRSARIFLTLGLFVLSSSPAFAASASRIHLSNNWAGYAALSDTYTGISATWTVPDSTKTSRTISADAAWVGIGGITEDDLIQAGTQAIIRNDRTEYMAWYELLPGSQIVIPLTISAGDRVYASVNEIAPDTWRITITDITTGQTYHTDIPYKSSHSSAEWIVERPLAITSSATGYLPLSDFGSVTFGDAQVTAANGQQTLEQSGAEQLIMTRSRSRFLAAPQIGDSSSFSVSYLTSSQSSKYLRTLRRTYTMKPESNVSSRTTRYKEINTNYIMHIVFSQAD